MSTNDNSASRRGRRVDQADRRAPARQDRDDRWDQSSSRERTPEDLYQDQRGRDNQAQRPGYSNFSRHAYPNQPDPALPQPQDYYQAPVQRNNSGRYVEPAKSAYTPPSPPYEPEPPHLGFHDSGRDDLFGRESGPPAHGNNPYGSQGAGYQSDPYDQNRGQQPVTSAGNRREDPQYSQREAPVSPVDDYERNYPARNAQEAQAAQFFLPDEEPQKQRASQADRGYTAPPPPPPPQYPGNTYPPQDNYDARYEDNWADEHALHDDDGGGAHHELAAQGNELDEDFFADEDELENDHIPAPKRSRKRLVIAALAGAIMVGGGGAYLYKSFKGGTEEGATPFIRADNRPLKELPGNPGGKQFPNGEKTIYDRLTPDGQQIQAAAYAPPAPVAPPSAQPAQGNSLEERIDEALRKAQQAGDAPQQPAPQETRSPDQPTVVRSESYRPDGTRVDGGRPMVTPTVADVNGGQLPPPFGTARQAVAAEQPPVTPFQTVPVQSSPAPQVARSASITPAEPTATPSGGYWVSLKSASDEKAIQRDLSVLTDKYKSVLGDVQVISKIADLGAKGVHYRAVAGPLNSRQEAMELCQKIKGVGGDKACFVTN